MFNWLILTFTPYFYGYNYFIIILELTIHTVLTALCKMHDVLPFQCLLQLASIVLVLSLVPRFIGSMKYTYNVSIIRLNGDSCPLLDAPRALPLLAQIPPGNLVSVVNDQNSPESKSRPFMVNVYRAWIQKLSYFWLSRLCSINLLYHRHWKVFKSKVCRGVCDSNKTSDYSFLHLGGSPFLLHVIIYISCVTLISVGPEHVSLMTLCLFVWFLLVLLALQQEICIKQVKRKW